MALSGTITGSTSNKYIDCNITWSATQSATDNYSDVTATLYYSRNNTGYTTSGTWSGSITINGTTTSASKRLEITYNSNTKAISATTRVYHNSDGTKSITISASGTISGTSLSSTNISSTVTLDTIPRASGVSCTSVNIESNPTITISKASASFKHTLRYEFGTLSGTIISKTDLSSYSDWTVPTAFYAQIPNSKSGSCTIYCDTYNGDTLVGTGSCKFTATAAKSLCEPSISPTVVASDSVTINTTGDENTLIRYFSHAKYTFNAEAKNGSHIVDYAVTCGNVVGTANTGTIEYIESGEFTFKVTDSRGYSTTQKITKNIIEYGEPTCNLSVGELSPDGEATLTIKGTYFSGTFGEGINQLEVRYSYKVGDGEYIDFIQVNKSNIVISENNTFVATVKLTGLDYTQKYTFQAYTSDKLKLIYSKEVSVKLDPVFDWGENDYNFNVPVKMALNQYVKNGTYGIDVNDSDIINMNGCYFKDVCDTNEEGIFFYRSDGGSDRFYGMNGDLYIAPSNGETSNKVLTSESISEIVDIIYPVGSIYMSVNNTSPATLFGGSWTQIEDKFILAAGSTYAGGDTGGAESYSLSTSHKHTSPLGYNQTAVGGVNVNGTVSTGNRKAYKTAKIDYSGTLTSNITAYYTGDATVSATIPTIPPYLAVYVWKRTA